MYNRLVEISCLIAWLMVLLPSIIYLITTWRIRRNKLFARLRPKSIRLYYKQFYPAMAKRIAEAEEHDYPRSFRKHFGALYGIRHYLLPLSLLALICGIGMLGVARSLLAWLDISTAYKPLPPIAVSAFLGAYAWVLYDQFTRFRAGDFTVHDIYGCIYRFLIAIPFGLSFAAVAKESVGLAVAFFLAAFPTKTLFKFARRLTTINLGLGESNDEGQIELERLQSIGRSNAERYLDEGVTSIVELAWSDPIDLTIRTNRDFSFVVDSISQALLWVYLEDEVKKLYRLSLRGAQEVCSLLSELDSDEPKARHAAELNLKAASDLLGIDKESFKYTLLTVRDDPYAQFIFSIWS
jgi:hypothetical protein